jgi:phenylacetic acid degradation operon negative regulatory protein
MQARSALFDLYGDHLRERGGVAPVAALVRLMATLDVAAPAVRTAISRMVRQGWLLPTTTERGPGYALSERATRRLDEAAARIYRTSSERTWNGRWELVLLPHPAERSRRERVHRAMQYLGYRELRTDAWIAPRSTPELEPSLEAEGVTAVVFTSSLRGDDQELLQLWQPEELASSYRSWLCEAEATVDAAGDDPDDERAFATRSRLVHEWRKFLFSDPGLPRELLPADWPGEVAAMYFDKHANRLAAGAARFVDACLTRREP